MGIYMGILYEKHKLNMMCSLSKHKEQGEFQESSWFNVFVAEKGNGRQTKTIKYRFHLYVKNNNYQ